VGGNDVLYKNLRHWVLPVTVYSWVDY